jgi:hypothetical protein
MWYIDNHVEAPGYGLPGCPPDRYQQRCQPDRGEWDLMAYVYDYRFGPETFQVRRRRLLQVDHSPADASSLVSLSRASQISILRPR